MCKRFPFIFFKVVTFQNTLNYRAKTNKKIFVIETQKNISQEDIAKWYGLKEFIIIKPDDNDSSLSDFNNIQNLMSTLTILESELRSGMPIFAKIHQIDCYQGLYFHEENNWKISFENVHLRKVPSNYYNLEAILKIFKSKVSKDIFNLGNF